LLTRIFGPDTEERTGGWRSLCIEVLHKLYSSQNIDQMMENVYLLRNILSKFVMWFRVI